MDNTGLNPEEKQKLDIKFDIILKELKELKNLNKGFEEKFLNTDKKTERLAAGIQRLESQLAKLDSNNEVTHKQIFESLNRIDSKIDKLDSTNQEEHTKLFENIERIDRRITALKSDNQEEHKKISTQLDSINCAFIRYEVEGTDKINILFDANVDRKNHQDIYEKEFKKLNELVSKNSFRISSLEHHFINNN